MTAPDQQGLSNTPFQMTMRGFYCPILMAYPWVIAGGLESVMSAQVMVAYSQLFFLSQVVKCGTQAIGSVFLRYAATTPQSVLKSG